MQSFIQGRSKKTPKLGVTGLYAGKSPLNGEFPAQMACNAENASISWRHYGGIYYIDMGVVSAFLIEWCISCESGIWFDIKILSYRYIISNCGVRTGLRSCCLVHLTQRRVFEIDWYQARQEATSWWRHKGPVTSQLTNYLIKWFIYPSHSV